MPMSLKALAIVLVAFALTGNVVAQGDPRACGDFDFSGGPQFGPIATRVAAAEILNELRSCDVHVLNAGIDGDLILQSVTIEHGLIFKNVQITGIASFSGVTFKGDVAFIGTTFKGDADFIGTTASRRA